MKTKGFSVCVQGERGLRPRKESGEKGWWTRLFGELPIQVCWLYSMFSSRLNSPVTKALEITLIIGNSNAMITFIGDQCGLDPTSAVLTPENRKS